MEFTLVDVGCGYGDLLRAVRRWARKRSVAIRLIGLDLNRDTIRIGKKRSPTRPTTSTIA